MVRLLSLLIFLVSQTTFAIPAPIEEGVEIICNPLMHDLLEVINSLENKGTARYHILTRAPSQIGEWVAINGAKYYSVRKHINLPRIPDGMYLFDLKTCELSD